MDKVESSDLQNRLLAIVRDMDDIRSDDLDDLVSLKASMRKIAYDLGYVCHIVRKHFQTGER